MDEVWNKSITVDELHSMMGEIQSWGNDTEGLNDPKDGRKSGILNALWGHITGSLSDQTDLMNYLIKMREELEEEIAGGGSAANVFIYKGQVATFADLPNNATVGSVYDVAESGANYVWNGSSWDKLSENIDVSSFVTEDRVKELCYIKSEVNALLQALQEAVDTKLEGKAAATDLSDEITARENADTTLQNAINGISTNLNNYYNKSEIDDIIDDLPVADNVYTKAEADALLANKANASDLSDEASARQHADADLQNAIGQVASDLAEHIADADANAATKAELADAVQTLEQADSALDGRIDALEGKDTVEYTDISNPENPNRKAIVFKNHDGVFGKDTEGNTRNIAMISKYNVADFGTPHLHTNLNTQQIVTVNDNQAVLTDKNINNILLAGDNVTIDENTVTDPTTGFIFKTYTFNAQLSETSAKIEELEQAIADEIQDRQSADDLKADKTELASLEASLSESLAEINGDIADLELNKANVTDLTNGLALKANLSETYTKTEVDGLISDLDIETIFHYKGSVEDERHLPAEGNKTGDVWNVEDTGSNFAWNGDGWDKLSETIDLTPYDKIVDREAAINELKSKIWTGTLQNGHLYSKKTNAEGGYALIFNESDGGGSQVYDKTDDVISYVGTNLEEGEGAENGVNVQIYSKNKTTNEGVRINVNTQKAYYLKGANVPNPAKRELAVVEDITTAKAELQEDIDTKASQSELSDLQDNVDQALATQDGDIQSLLLKINELESKINDVKSLDPEIVVLYDGGDTEYTNKERDFVLSGQINSGTAISGNSIMLKETTIAAAYVDLLAARDVTIKDTTMTGLVPKKITNALFKVRSDGYVAVRDCTINPESAYNGIEIGLGTGLAKSVTIENTDFAGHFSNNGVNVFGMVNEGVITISNCHFADVSNAIRLSNRTNTKWTLNIINCTFDKWETNGDYAGMILLQDYTSTSEQEVIDNNMFHNLTINIQNCFGPSGKITMPNDLSTICGCKNANQLIYLYDGYRGVSPYSAEIYPTIHIS